MRERNGGVHRSELCRGASLRWGPAAPSADTLQVYSLTQSCSLSFFTIKDHCNIVTVCHRFFYKPTITQWWVVENANNNWCWVSGHTWPSPGPPFPFGRLTTPHSSMDGGSCVRRHYYRQRFFLHSLKKAIEKLNLQEGTFRTPLCTFSLRYSLFSLQGFTDLCQISKLWSTQATVFISLILKL